MAYLQKE